MKNISFYFLIYILIGFISCENINSHSIAIEAVKKLDWYGGEITTGEAIAGLVGMEGKVKWNTFRPEGKEEHIICVEPILTKTDKDQNKHTLRLQFLYNKQTELVQLVYIELDGESQPLLGFGEWAFEFAKYDLDKMLEEKK